MTFINRLIKEAKVEPQPRELTIRPNQVRALADHAMGSTFSHSTAGPSRDDIDATIRNGGLRLLNIPVRVLLGD